MTLSRHRLGRWVVGLSLTIAVLTLAVGGLLRSVLHFSGVINTLRLVAYLLPAGGLLLVTSVLWSVRRSAKGKAEPDEFAQSNVEQVERETAHTGREIEQQIENAAIDCYQCEETYSIVNIKDRLKESAIRAVKSSTGASQEQARQMLESGTWTDDRVAAAFLSPRCTQPLSERLRSVLDPGQGFYRRLNRTITAIEALEETTVKAGGAETLSETAAGNKTNEAGTVQTLDSSGSPEEVRAK
ncbi:hypothetical protein ACFQJ7_16050 [Halovenus rubra]|uniref:Uncharacterized protein n=2 Tax=Halovenus rubra TaxID=869890 RepID=A0ABD5XE84_9EURY|nr:hypothetical protein [Halovenus rubra]